jgi:hypothetical protein
VGLPGVVYGSGIGGNLAVGNVSQVGRLVNINPGWSEMVNDAENSFVEIRQRILSRVTTPITITHAAMDGPALIDLLMAAGADNKIAGVTILKYDGNLTFTNGLPTLPIDIGSRQAIILVNNGSVNINSPMKFTKGAGFLAIIAQNDISILSGVGQVPVATAPYQADIVGDETTYMPHLMGVYYAGGTFSTGASANQLEVLGSVIGMGGVSLDRTSKGPYPAEFFHCDPRSIKILRDVGLRRIVTQEMVW